MATAFISYAHRDEKYLTEFKAHLAPLRRQGLLDHWYDRDMTAGDALDPSILGHLEAADLIPMLISSDFINSDYCYGKEMTRALERHKAGQARAISIICRPCEFRGLPFAVFVLLPTDAKAVSTWTDQDSAWLDVVRGIRKAIAPTAASPVAQTSTKGQSAAAPRPVSIGAIRLPKRFNDLGKHDFLVEAFEEMFATFRANGAALEEAPPFGKKQSYRIVRDDGEIDTEREDYDRQDFFVTTSNKQLNFLQHIMTVLAPKGEAAVVLPDNVLFEGGAGETIRRRLLRNFDFHTLLRLPTGIFYKQGVKANVLFFDKRPPSDEAATMDLWIYDLRTNQRFTLKERPLTRADLDDFVACYRSARRAARVETERFRRFPLDALMARDKINLDLFWLKDDSLDDPDLLPPPHEVAAGIVEKLAAALERFR
jgi:hypothetical protein